MDSIGINKHTSTFPSISGTIHINEVISHAFGILASQKYFELNYRPFWIWYECVFVARIYFEILSWQIDWIMHVFAFNVHTFFQHLPAPTWT